MNHLYKPIVAALAIFLYAVPSTAQNVAIGHNNPHPSAKLHIEDPNRGLLIPSISIANVATPAPVLAPAQGLLVWNSNPSTVGGNGVGFYYWDGAGWLNLSSSSGTDDQNLTNAVLTGNNLTVAIENGNPVTVDLSSLVNDADAIVGNEYNTAFALTGTNLTLTDGGGARTVNLAGLNESGRNGLRNMGNFVHLGGPLMENTVVTAGTYTFYMNLNSTGDFHIQDNGVNKFTVLDNGMTRFGGDVEWRDETTTGTILMQLLDDGNDGRFRIFENGAVSVDFDANTQFIINEQGFDRNFRVESNTNANMLFLDAGANRVAIGTDRPVGTFNVQGTSYHSDDLYLRDGNVHNGDILVRIYDSGDDGIISVYENNGVNHRIHGNGVSVFNEQGNNNADLRMESDANANMFFLNAGTNRIGIGTGAPTEALHIQGGTRTTTGAIVGAPATYGTHLVSAGQVANPSIQFGNMAFNNAESGRLTFEENIPNYGTAGGPYCGFQIYHNGANNTLNISSACTGETTRMTFERNGEIGIATPNPTARLSVNGTANKTGGGTWAVFSDARLKSDVSDYTEGLDLITQVRTVNFKYNEQMTAIWGEDDTNLNRVYQGVIAQELQQIAPDMVREVALEEAARPEDADYTSATPTSETYLEVDPNKFTYALINAVQEQQVQIKALQAEVAALRAAQAPKEQP